MNPPNDCKFNQKRVMPTMSNNVVIFAMSNGDVESMFALDALFNWDPERARSAIRILDQNSIYGKSIVSMWHECSDEPDTLYWRIIQMAKE